MIGRRADAGHLLITGSSGAIGDALARTLRARWPEAPITLLDRALEPSRRLAAELGGTVRLRSADLTELDALPDVLADVEAAQGPVHGLVNCAGVMEVRRFEGLAWTDAEALLRVDLLAPLRLMHACVPGMLRAGSGFVINVTSMAGRVPLRGCAFYGAAKAGLAMASEIAHAELRRRGVQVVTVYPGPVHSALEARARAQYPKGFLTRRIPTGMPDEVAHRTMAALARRRPRVVYPALYELGWHAPVAAARFALGWGPDPVT